MLNAMTPKYYRTSQIVDLPRKPPITWLRGAQDQVDQRHVAVRLRAISVRSVPSRGGPEDVLPPQPMAAQTRAVLDAYRARGGVAEEITLEDAAHGMPVEVPDRVAEVIAARLVR